MFWKRIANQNHFLDCISCAIVEIAARHGESSRLNSRKENAATADGNHALIAAPTIMVSSASSPATFARTPIVLTMDSFAENPEMDAATGCHLPNPRGAKIGARIPPRIAMILSLLSSTNPIPLPVLPMLERTHMITVARKRIVPALMMKPFSLSQT